MNIYCIIVTYNAENWIEKCLNSVLNSTIKSNIIVIDNQSVDNTCAIIKEKFSMVRLIKNQSNEGFGKANNIGIRLAYHEGAEYIFLLNQDAFVEPNTIEILAEQLQLNPDFGILSPVHFYEKNKLDYKFKNYIKGKEEQVINHSTSETIIQLAFVNAAIWMLSRKCIEEIGVFAPVFSHYGEDLNFAHRCKYHGIKLGIVPFAKAYHLRVQNPPKEKGIKVTKLIERDKNYCYGIMLNIKHYFFRQCIFLLFNSIKELIIAIFTLHFKTAFVRLIRIKYFFIPYAFIEIRKKLKQKGAFL